VTIDGVWIGEWTYWQQTWLVSTSNYSAVTDLHTSQITGAHAKSSQPAVSIRFLVSDLNNGDSSAPVLISLLFGKYPTSDWTHSSLTVLLITSLHGPHRKHHSSVLAFMSVAAGTCLPSHSIAATICSHLLRISCLATTSFHCLLRGRCLETNVVYRVTA
jgi:hypothetical protein